MFTQQDTIYSHAHLVLTNLLITSLLVLCLSQWLLLFLPPKFLLISCRPLDSYSDICYLGTDELIMFVSFLWMIWVDLPFLIYLSPSPLTFWSGQFSFTKCFWLNWPVQLEKVLKLHRWEKKADTCHCWKTSPETPLGSPSYWQWKLVSGVLWLAIRAKLS